MPSFGGKLQLISTLDIGFLLEINYIYLFNIYTDVPLSYNSEFQGGPIVNIK